MVHKKGVRGPAKKRQLVIEDIVQGASALLEKTEGDAALVTLGDLARSLGYATTAIYRYFPSKEALIVELQQRALLGLAGDLQHALDTHAQELARRTRGAEAKRSTPDDTRLEHTRARSSRGAETKRSTPEPDGARRPDAGEQPPHAEDLQRWTLERIAIVAAVYASLPARAPGRFRLIAVSLGDPKVMVPDAQAKNVALAIAALLARVEELLEDAARAGAIDRGSSKDPRAPVLLAALHGALLLDKLARLDLPALASRALVPETLVTVLTGFGAPRAAAKTAVAAALKKIEKLFPAERN